MVPYKYLKMIVEWTSESLSLWIQGQGHWSWCTIIYKRASLAKHAYEISILNSSKVIAKVTAVDRKTKIKEKAPRSLTLLYFYL